MNILIGCEESQAICIEFLKRGHNAFSNDLKVCSGNHPEWHLQMDVFDAINSRKWDLIILHPDCTCMAVSGNHKYAIGKPGYSQRLDAIIWTNTLWEYALSKCDHVALENPVSVIFQHLKDGTLQYIQPYQFGHPESKKTGLFLHGLPKLQYTNVLHIPACGYWDNQTPSRQNKLGPSANRKEIRSKTYKGIAEAIATQWGNL